MTGRGLHEVGPRPDDVCYGLGHGSLGRRAAGRGSRVQRREYAANASHHALTGAAGGRASVTRRLRRPAGLAAHRARPRRRRPPAAGDARAATPATAGRATACHALGSRRRASSRRRARPPARLHRALRRRTRRRSRVASPSGSGPRRDVRRRPTAARADRRSTTGRLDVATEVMAPCRTTDPVRSSRRCARIAFDAGRYTDALAMRRAAERLGAPGASALVDGRTGHLAILRPGWLPVLGPAAARLEPCAAVRRRAASCTSCRSPPVSPGRLHGPDPSPSRAPRSRPGSTPTS